MRQLFLGSAASTGIAPAGQGVSLPALPERRLSKPMRGVIASRDERLGQEMRQAIAACNPFLPVTVLNQQLEPLSLERIIENERVAVLFLEVDGTPGSNAILDEVSRLNRGTQIIAFSRYATAEILLQLMRRGLREWVKLPADQAELAAALERVRHALEFRPPRFQREGHVLSFLPAKPGSGASTIAAHAAAVFARSVNGKSALLDLDLTCGIQGFIHAICSSLTVTDAAEYADRMDENLWNRMVARSGDVDILRSGYPTPGRRIDPAAVQSLLDFAESRYPIVCADLSGNWERFAIETLERSSLVFLTTTPDFASLHLARRHLDLLEEIGVRGRTRVILNRCAWRQGFNRSLVRQILGTDHVLELPNAYEPLQNSLKLGRLLPSSSPFVRELQRLPARTLPGIKRFEERPARNPAWSNALAGIRSWLLPAPQNA